MDDVAVKRVRKRIKRNKLTLFSMGAARNEVYILENEAGDSKEAKEIGKSGNNDKVVT